MFNFSKTTKSVLLAVLLVMSVFAGGAGLATAAAPTAGDTTGSTSADITDGGSQTYNETTTSDLPWSADSPNASIEITQDGETLFEASPENYSAADTGSDGNLDTWYYNVSVADDGSDYSGLDADAGESVTLNITITNDTTVDNPDTTNISFTFSNGQVEAFEDVSDDSVQTASGGYLSFLSDNETKAKSDSTVGISGNQTETVTMNVAGTPMADALDVSAEATESGDVMWGSASSLNGDYVVVANSEAPDTDWFNDSAAYATYDADAQTLTYHNVDEWVDSDAQDVELSATGNDGLGIFNTASMMTNYDAGWGSAFGTAALNADVTEPSWDDEE